MQDPRITALARVLVEYSLKIKPDDKFLINGSDLALPLIQAVYRNALRAGAHPEVSLAPTGIDEIMLKEGTDAQIMYISPRARLPIEQYDVLLFIEGGYNTKPLAGVDAARIALGAAARKELNITFANREAASKLRWCCTQFPTHSDAQEAGMSLDEYEAFVFGAGLLDAADPVQAWREVSARQQRICDMLSTTRDMRIRARDTDLRFSVAGRKWVNCDGTINFPDGEVFTTPIKESLNGQIRFDYPAIHSGKEVDDIRLTFRDGKVIEARAERGEALLHALLDTDENARYVGEVAIGTNYGIQRFTKNILFDEKIGGTVHLAVGMGFPETGGTNESAIHWDMLCEMKHGGEIYADNVLIYRNGRFIKEFET